MSSETDNTPPSPSQNHTLASSIIARQDRIPVWGLPYHFLGIIGLGFMFTYFDVFDINVSFIQTCTQIIRSCTALTATKYIGLPVLLNLAGYTIGTLILSPLADRYGRRELLLVTMMITGLGSLYNAFTHDYTNFIIARTITGMGLGSEVIIVNTYINEIAPNANRARYTSLIFIMSSLGAFIGIWLGLYLTTPARAFPFGLPFAIASSHFTSGWRVMYGIGALLAAIGILLRFQLPESPRWLISQGRIPEADHIIKSMEKRATAHMPLLPQISEIPVLSGVTRVPIAEIFSTTLYLRRTLLLLLVWLISYVTVFSISAGLTTILSSLGYLPSEAGLITAIGTIGFILTTIFAYMFGESLERKYWLPIASVLTFVGGMLIALSGKNHFGITALGSIILFFGFNLWVPITFTWSTENYPTRVRATGFAFVNGIGHIGGGIGLLIIAPLIPILGIVNTFFIISGCLVVAAIIAQFGIATRKKRLDEVSP